MARKKLLRVGVLFGGRSSEHEISLRSALTVMSAMDPKRYEIVPIGIGRDGRWYLEHDALKLLAEKTPHLAALTGSGTQVTLLPHPDDHALVPSLSDGAGGDAIALRKTAGQSLDVVFPVLHGSYGEDGTVQGLLELAGIPYVGAGVLGSAIGMDKDVQKRLLRDAGVPVVRYFSIERTDYDEDPGLAARLARKLGYPVFVKPNAIGSSIGISKVKRAAELKAALDDSFQYDRKSLIEASCEGREIECSVLGNDRPEASIPGEILIKGAHEFYTYESKYVDPHGSEVKIPADLPRAIAKKISAMAVAAFKALSLRGMARVDFLARRDLREIYVNEVNTIPGFTAISMYPKLWEASGLPLPKLIDRLIELALEEHGARADLKITYQPKH
jgi:D-alanine-D-alanine ligase